MARFTPRSGRRPLALLSTAAATVLLAGACAGSEPSDDIGGQEPVVRADSSAVVPADAADPANIDPADPRAPAESSTDVVPDAPDALIPGGWGPITAGMSEEQLADLGYTVTIDRPARGNNLCSDGSIEVDGQPLFVQFLGNRLAGVSTSNSTGLTSSLATAEGLSNGSPTSDVPALYPGVEEVGTQVGIIYVVTDPADPGMGMSFTDNGGVIREIRAGDASYVKYFESCLDFSGTGG